MYTMVYTMLTIVHYKINVYQAKNCYISFKLHKKEPILLKTTSASLA